MPNIISSTDKDFLGTLQKIMELQEENDSHVEKRVEEIIRNIRKKGDSALNEYTRKWDNPAHKAGDFSIPVSALKKASESISAKTRKGLQEAIERVESYHKKQLPKDIYYTDGKGVKLGWKWCALDSAGIYVPGGTASYPSSVIMNAIPAKVAGVKRIVMVVPAPKGKINPVVFAAAYLCGVKEVYKIGGAQAIAALAYGTESIKPVDKIVGPGNAYVATAKRRVFGKVGIDMIAGPSEIAVIADDKNNPDWIAADLLSQAEHDKDAKVFLISNSESFIKAVQKSIGKILPKLARKEIAGAAIKNNSTFIKVKNLDEACKVADIIAPEHLELAIEKPETLAKKIKHAGAIFMGRYTPEAIGDYIAGPSHVLPTSGTARFSSGLSVYDFIKRTSLIGCDEKSFKKLAEQTENLAKEEGLTAHALSISIRNDRK